MYIVCIYTCYDMCAWSYPTVTPQTVGHQAPLSMGFSRQGCWSRLPFPTPWDLPNPGTGPSSLMSPALAGRFLTTAPPGRPTKDAGSPQIDIWF